MTVELSSPDGLLRQDLYRHVATASGSRTVFVAGQTATPPDGGEPTGDLRDQVQTAIRNVVTVIRGAGGGPEDITRLTAFVVGWTTDSIEPFEGGLARACVNEGLPSPLPPLTVIGVQALYRPAVLVEVEATAVLD